MYTFTHSIRFRDKMTKFERMAWNRTHPDYRCRVGGIPMILELNLDNGATQLVPIKTSRKVKEIAAAAGQSNREWR